MPAWYYCNNCLLPLDAARVKELLDRAQLDPKTPALCQGCEGVLSKGKS